MPTRTCDTCKQPYSYTRVTSKYCSAACRYHAHLGRNNRHRMPTDLRYAVLARDNFTCQACGASTRDTPPAKLHVDHIVPVSMGGAPLDSRNLHTLCQDCNLGKNNLTTGAHGKETS